MNFTGQTLRRTLNSQNMSKTEVIPVCTIICDGNTSKNDSIISEFSMNRQMLQISVLLRSLVFFSESNFRIIILTNSESTYKKTLSVVNKFPQRYVIK